MKILKEKNNNNFIFLHNKEMGINFNEGRISIYYPWQKDNGHEEIELYQLLFDNKETNIVAKLKKKIDKMIIKLNKKTYNGKFEYSTGYITKEKKIKKNEFISLLLKDEIDELYKQIKGDE